VQIVEDASRSGQAHHVIMSGRMAVVDYLIWENRCIAINETAGEIKISVVSAHTIIAEEVHYRTVFVVDS
jgi:hypothetical protein